MRTPDPEAPYGRCPDCGGVLDVHVFDNELAWLACDGCGAAPGASMTPCLPTST